MMILISIAMRLSLASYYLAMAILSLFSPKHGRILIDDAEEAVRRRQAQANTPKIGDRV